MKKQVYVFLADGFEEIEGLTVVDLLRRAGIEVTTISIMEEKRIHGAHGIDVLADALFEEVQFTCGDMLVLPGGLPGTDHLEAHDGLIQCVKNYYEEGKYIAAICAAPRIFGHLGLLEGRKAIAYPAMECELQGAVITKEPVVVDGPIITARGMGAAIPFALQLIAVLQDEASANAIGRSIVYKE